MNTQNIAIWIVHVLLFKYLLFRGWGVLVFVKKHTSLLRKNVFKMKNNIFHSSFPEFVGKAGTNELTKGKKCMELLIVALT